MVALYSADRKSARDSFLQVERPDYYAFSEEDGSFRMTNIKGGPYILAAFEDKDGDFKLNSAKAERAFWADTVLISPDTILDLKLLTYAPEQALRYFGTRLEAQGHIQFSFNKAADSFKIEAVNAVPDSAFFYFNKTRDTLNYYFDFKADSLLFKLNFDTVFVDSVITVRMRRMPDLNLKFGTTQKEMRPKDTIVFRSNRPILSWEADSTWYISKKDSLHQIPVVDSVDPFTWYFLPPQKSDLRFEMKEGAIRSARLDFKRAKSFDFKLMSGEDLGTIDFKVKVADSSSAYILQILEDDDKPYLIQSFRDSTQVSIRNEIPRKFKAFLIQDRDGNGKFSTGNFKKAILPEKRVKYQESLEIRANWELVLEWNFIPH